MQGDCVSLGAEKFQMAELVKSLHSLTFKVQPCGWCHSNAINVLILECNHLSMCQDCLKEHSSCPECETFIKHVLKVTVISTPYLEQLRKETLDLWIKYACVVCKKETKNILSLDCNHIALCQNCLKGTPTCPICETAITQSTIVFY